MPNGWRVRINNDATSFMRDEIRLHIAYRTDEGLRLAAPITITLGEPIPDDVTINPEFVPTSLPTELAELLLSALGHALLGTDGADMARTIATLRAQLSKAEYRLDSLIEGLRRGAINAN